METIRENGDVSSRFAPCTLLRIHFVLADEDNLAVHLRPLKEEANVWQTTTFFHGMPSMQVASHFLPESDVLHVGHDVVLRWPRCENEELA